MPQVNELSWVFISLSYISILFLLIFLLNFSFISVIFKKKSTLNTYSFPIFL